MSRKIDPDKVLERFVRATKRSMKDSSRKRMIWRWKHFARKADIHKYSKRQMLTSTGKELILDYLHEHVPDRSVKTVNSYLKQLFEKGMGVVWPIDLREDYRRLPNPRPVRNPSDKAVKKWHEAMKHENDVYLRLCFRLVAYTGHRPSHITGLDWRHLFVDDDLEEMYLLADGSDAGFKTSSFVICRLPTDLREDIDEWRGVLKAKGIDVRSENPILPYRDRGKVVHPERRTDHRKLRTQWSRIQKVWTLPRLTARDLRHWVATQCRKSGLSLVASAYMMGHSPFKGHMRQHYDNPPVQEIILEQAQQLPKGTLGMLDEPEIRLQGITPEESEVLARFKAGEITSMELAMEMEKLKNETGPDQLLTS